MLITEIFIPNWVIILVCSIWGLNAISKIVNIFLDKKLKELKKELEENNGKDIN